MIKNGSKISQLQSNWSQLHDLDRAKAVANLRRSGISIRSIARQLGCSESLLRHLLLALWAPAVDLAAARNGTLSTNEVVRRTKAEGTRRQQKQSKNRELNRKRKVTKASKAISDWLKKEHLDESRGEAVAQEARSMLIADCASGSLPQADPRVTHPAAEWIERCRPNGPIDDGTHYIACYALWLARWSFCFCRDPHIAIDALTIVGRL